MAVKLSDDILSVIFLKLPVKSIIRCRCVCKSWRQLLCDPQFVGAHLNHIGQNHDKLLLVTSDCFYSVDYEASRSNAVPRKFPLKNIPPPYTRIWGSCNGMLCVAVRRKMKVSDDKTLVKLFLWNPATGDYRKLPNADPPVDDLQIVGFGYDSSLDDYKIVRIITCDYKPRVDTYSLKTNSWKFIRDLPHRDVFNQHNAFNHYDVFNLPNVFSRERRGGVCVNGSIYWVLGSQIIGFDLNNEKFRVLPWPCFVPQRTFKDVGSCYSSTIGGYLLMHYMHDGKLVVWELKKNDDRKEEWIKWMTVSFQDAEISWSSLDTPMVQAWLIEKCEVPLHKKELIRKEAFVGKYFTRGLLVRAIYDLKRSSVLKTSARYVDWGTYTESLVSPNFT